MTKIEDALRGALDQRQHMDKKFLEQIEQYSRFKERMRQAGVVYGDRYVIPLMSRLGHVVRDS